MQTRHVSSLLVDPSFASLPEAAKLAILRDQKKLLSAGTADLRQALDRMGFLGSDHPTVLAIYVTMACAHDEADAVEEAMRQFVAAPRPRRW